MALEPVAPRPGSRRGSLTRRTCRRPDRRAQVHPRPDSRGVEPRGNRARSTSVDNARWLPRSTVLASLPTSWALPSGPRRWVIVPGTRSSTRTTGSCGGNSNGIGAERSTPRGGALRHPSSRVSAGARRRPRAGRRGRESPFMANGRARAASRCWPTRAPTRSAGAHPRAACVGPDRGSGAGGRVRGERGGRRARGASAPDAARGGEGSRARGREARHPHLTRLPAAAIARVRGRRGAGSRTSRRRSRCPPRRRS